MRSYKKFLTDLIDDWFIIPYQIIKTAIYWGWLLKDNHAFDCYMIYFFIWKDTEKLIKYSRKEGHCQWNQEGTKRFKRLQIASNLAKRLWEDDYNIKYNEHKKKWNISDNDIDFVNHEMVFTSDKGLDEETLTKKLKDALRSYKEDEQHKNSEKEYLFKLLYKNLDGWWD